MKSMADEEWLHLDADYFGSDLSSARPSYSGSKRSGSNCASMRDTASESPRPLGTPPQLPGSRPTALPTSGPRLHGELPGAGGGGRAREPGGSGGGRGR